MKRTLLTAAILSLSAFGANSAQKADVKFSFRTPVGEHAPGSYNLTIRHTSGSNYMELRSAETGKAVLFYPTNTLTSYRAEAPRLVFRCGKSACDLAEVWTTSQGFAVRQRKPTPAEAERMAVTVPLQSAAAE